MLSQSSTPRPRSKVNFDEKKMVPDSAIKIQSFGHYPVDPINWHNVDHIVFAETIKFEFGNPKVTVHKDNGLSR